MAANSPNDIRWLWLSTVVKLASDVTDRLADRGGKPRHRQGDT